MGADKGPNTTGRSKAERWDRLRDAYVSGKAVWALLLLLLGSVALTTALSMRVGQAHDPLGGRFFPVMVSASLTVAALAVLLSPLVRLLLGRDPAMGEGSVASAGTGPDVDPADEPEGLLRKPLGRVAAMAAVAIAYVALLDVIGYIPATILGMAGALWVLQVRGLRALFLGPVVMSVSLYLIFTNLLFVRLP